MPIANLLSPGIDPVYNEPGFHLLVETHLDNLRSAENTVTQPVTDHETYKYRYDLFGFLTSINIAQQLHWATMRMSGLHSPIEFDGEVTALRIPHPQAIDRLRQLYLTSLTNIGKK